MRYFVVAGEASGDLHGGHLIEELGRLDAGARFCFLGGDCMSAAAGCGPVVHFSQMAFMGFVAVVRNFPAIRRITERTHGALLDFRPDKLILIDYPGFNLRLAKWVRRHLPGTEVVYYISPKLWAWKSYRLRSIRRYVDRMFTVFPFETQWYADRDYYVEYVGNPTVDSVSEFLSGGGGDAAFGGGMSGKPVVALLPGSRRQEIVGCLPRMAQLAPLFPEYRFVVAAAPGADLSLYGPLSGDGVEVVEASTYELLRSAYAAVVNSGTATLETALFGVPQVVVYNVVGGAFTRLLKRIVIKIPHVSLVNIIAGKQVVTELIADQFTVQNMAAELRKIAQNDAFRAEMCRNYGIIVNALGEPGAARRCAERILS